MIFLICIQIGSRKLELWMLDLRMLELQQQTCGMLELRDVRPAGCQTCGMLELWRLELRILDLRMLDLRILDLRILDLRTLDLRTLDLRTFDLRILDLRISHCLHEPFASKCFSRTVDFTTSATSLEPCLFHSNLKFNVKSSTELNLNSFFE